MNKKQISQAWVIFFGGLLVEIISHYAIRVYTQIEIREYEPHWFLVQVILAIFAGYFLLKATRNIEFMAKRMVIICINVVLGYFLYLIILLWYVVGTGLDSL